MCSKYCCENLTITGFELLDADLKLSKRKIMHLDSPVCVGDPSIPPAGRNDRTKTD